MKWQSLFSGENKTKYFKMQLKFLPSIRGEFNKFVEPGVELTDWKMVSTLFFNIIPLYFSAFGPLFF